ncbi:MAG: AAA family ATPase [Okeania sp. SIO3I5]|uniref:AAA family ATPase n=1 Tax=Okeania sp. SIO3I5 TaxID=2607805 RepID=UPI0013B69932|nr:AAA family ATPase [Okeania sp. SIO3I5]NEQ37323.1 AAA family ATPase [Okeania sp. SIO3I5]
MLKSLTINNFRCFQSFELQQLSRVNLLVGMNNSGKTSILEAIQLLYSFHQPGKFHKMILDRGEYFTEGDRQLDIRHLFYGREISLGSEFSIVGNNGKEQEKFIASIQTEYPNNSEQDISDNSEEFRDELESSKKLVFILDWQNQPVKIKRNLSDYGGVYLGDSNWAILATKLNTRVAKSIVKSQFIAPLSLNIREISKLFDEIVLTPEENLTLEALQIIEPKIERIASIGPEKYDSNNEIVGARGGFRVKVSDQKQPIPIGSMGEGIWRILALAIALVSAQGGVLLVDEIDTGLHFSTMSDMWKLIWKTAKKLDVQVFATTHNSDCWSSLADVIKSEGLESEEIKIHRIEADKNSSVVFTEPEIVIAAKRDIEVR